MPLTVEDEDAFTMPWSATITYRRPLGWQVAYNERTWAEWAEVVCAENPHELRREQDRMARWGSILTTNIRRYFGRWA